MRKNDPFTDENGARLVPHKEAWKNNTVAELIHGPADGAEIILPPCDKVVEVIEVPVMTDVMDMMLPTFRLGIYRRDGGTLRFHTGAPATIKFRYQETRDDKEPAE